MEMENLKNEVQKRAAESLLKLMEKTLAPREHVDLNGLPKEEAEKQMKKDLDDMHECAKLQGRIEAYKEILALIDPEFERMRKLFDKTDNFDKPDSPDKNDKSDSDNSDVFVPGVN